MKEEERTELITRLRDTLPGKAFLELLRIDLDEDVVNLATQDPNNVGLFGRLQGGLIRTQKYIHLLEAEYEPEEEES